MKTLLPLLAILLGGLLLGFAGARMIGSDAGKDGARIGSEASTGDTGDQGGNDAGFAADTSVQPAPAPEGQDQDQGYWPNGGSDHSLGPYAMDDNYFGRSDAGDDALDDGSGDAGNGAAAPLPSTRAGSEAATAGLAAEQAARDAAQVAAAAGPAVDARPAEAAPARPPRVAARVPDPTPTGTSREPRTADGKLPSIY